LNSVKSLEPAIDPNNKISFLLDWELTLKCNLDCSYCLSGPDGFHYNQSSHPQINDCLKTIDFMYQYVDMYMSLRPTSLRQVILNVYGGESLHHPDIVPILEQVRERYKPYTDRWNLTVTTTTNAIVSEKKLEKIIPLIDEFTVSYHSEASGKQKQQFKNNLLKIQSQGPRLKCVVPMHANEQLFEDSSNMISWLNQHQIRNIARALDHLPDDTTYYYKPKQVTWLKDFYQNKSSKPQNSLPEFEQSQTGNTNLSRTGRACCGGKQLCSNEDYKNRSFFVHNQFPDWHCSVNHFFLYIRQYTQDVYVNKDCKMNFQGSVGPIGNLQQSDKILAETKQFVETGNMPVIQCKKSVCLCGLCAPKAAVREDYDKIMSKHFKK
jgi:pyruvate-formate lyase-activating enzyme